MHTSKAKNILSGICMVVAIIMILVIVQMIELYSDDFYYITFFNHGIRGFITENIEHYQTVNGRVLVHLLDEIALQTGKWGYMIILPTMLITLFYHAIKNLLSAFHQKENFLYGIAFASCLFLLVDNYILKETAFWITGAFNYIFPLMMSFISVSVLRKMLEEKQYSFGNFLLLFLASATTEQGFVCTFFLTVSMLIIKRKDIQSKKIFLAPILELIGFATMFLSPASRLRAVQTKTIFNYPIFLLIEENFGKLAETIVGVHSIALPIAFLLLVMAILPLKDKSLSKILLFGFPIGGIILVAYSLGLYSETYGIYVVSILVIYVLFAMFQFFKVEEYRTVGLFIFVALCCQGTAFGLGETSYRTLLPLTLFIITITASLLTILLQPHHRCSLLILILLLGLGIYHILPTYQGYYQNKLIIDEMKESIQNYPQTGYVEINTNINKDYAHTMGYENPTFEEYFYEHYKISSIKDHVYFVTNGKDSILTINGKRVKYSALLLKNNIYLPLRFVIETLNGTCEWHDDRTIYSTQDYRVVIDNQSEKIIESSIAKYVGVDLSASLIEHLGRSYLHINDICYIIGNSPCEIKVGQQTFHLFE